VISASSTDTPIGRNVLDMREVLRWTRRPLGGSDHSLARLIAHAGIRAWTWFAAWHLAELVGTVVVMALLVAATVLSFISRRGRNTLRPRRRIERRPHRPQRRTQ
jgi:hypothetical protein